MSTATDSHASPEPSFLGSAPHEDHEDGYVLLNGPSVAGRLYAPTLPVDSDYIDTNFDGSPTWQEKLKAEIAQQRKIYDDILSAKTTNCTETVPCGEIAYDEKFYIDIAPCRRADFYSKETPERLMELTSGGANWSRVQRPDGSNWSIQPVIGFDENMKKHLGLRVRNEDDETKMSDETFKSRAEHWSDYITDSEAWKAASAAFETSRDNADFASTAATLKDLTDAVVKAQDGYTPPTDSSSVWGTVALAGGIATLGYAAWCFFNKCSDEQDQI